jgi:hypothetical protein
LIGSETVTTFDGLFYNASFSGCDQVLTKDCSGRYKFAVLSRVEGDKKANIFLSLFFLLFFWGFFFFLLLLLTRI